MDLWMHAAREGDLNKVMHLVDQGIDVNVLDKVRVYVYTYD